MPLPKEMGPENYRGPYAIQASKLSFSIRVEPLLGQDKRAISHKPLSKKGRSTNNN
jgi:hypothetical protein